MYVALGSLFRSMIGDGSCIFGNWLGVDLGEGIELEYGCELSCDVNESKVAEPNDGVKESFVSIELS